MNETHAPHPTSCQSTDRTWAILCHLSLNFAATLALASMVASILAFTVILLPAAWIIWAVICIVSILIPIIAAMAAARYEKYRYPLTLPLLR